LALARTLLDRAGLSDAFELAIDASAGDWSAGERYTLPVTGVTMDRDELLQWWLGLIERHDLRWVEDPFAETDRAGWRMLHDRRPAACRILGDNLTSTLPEQLAVKAPLVDGVLLKPDQNGTVSGSRAFAALARERGLALITSHRSIETDSPFLVHLSREIGADAIKVGPYSDFSSVLRSNELLRTSPGVVTPLGAVAS
jgi:enolase